MRYICSCADICDREGHCYHIKLHEKAPDYLGPLIRGGVAIIHNTCNDMLNCLLDNGAQKGRRSPCKQATFLEANEILNGKGV